MNRHSRIITAILSVLFAISAMTSVVTVTAFAESEISGEISSEAGPGGGESQGGGETPESQVTPEPSPGGGESHQESQASYDPGYESHGGYDPGYESQGGGYDPGYVDPGNGGNDGNNNNNNNNDIYYGNDGRAYSNPGDVYVGGDQTYTPPSNLPATTAALYDTSKSKVDENTLSSNDWNDIKSKLTGTNTASNSDDGDFTFIQKNADIADNGHWMLILGFALIILSIIGFVYLIYSAVQRRKSTAPVQAKASSESGNLRYRSKDDYNDQFDTEGKSEAKSSKPKNGKRYK